jgi:3',5'-cyclic AMP phosphodiesterase CpdA
LAVLTDLHLFDHRGDRGLASRFRRLIQAVADEDPPVHLVVVLGDIGHHGTLAEQQRFVELARLSLAPLLAIPGNHDFKDGHIDHYLAVVTPYLDHVTRLGPYVLVGLNSGPGKFDESRGLTNAESVGLESTQIDWLDSATAQPDRMELVFVHHPPYSVYRSVIGKNRKRFLRVCKANSVRAILSGHTHINEVYDRDGVAEGLDTKCGSAPAERRLPLTLITARSTNPKAGGYRKFELYRDGRFEYCWKYVDVE